MFTISLGLNFGICRFLTDFVSDLEENLRQLDALAKQFKGLSIEQQAEMKLLFVDIIQFYSDARELSQMRPVRNEIRIYVQTLRFFLVFQIHASIFRLKRYHCVCVHGILCCFILQFVSTNKRCKSHRTIHCHAYLMARFVAAPHSLRSAIIS